MYFTLIVIENMPNSHTGVEILCKTFLKTYQYYMQTHPSRQGNFNVTAGS